MNPYGTPAFIGKHPVVWHEKTMCQLVLLRKFYENLIFSFINLLKFNLLTFNVTFLHTHAKTTQQSRLFQNFQKY